MSAATETELVGSEIATVSAPADFNAHVVRYLRHKLHEIRARRGDYRAADAYQTAIKTERNRVLSMIVEPVASELDRGALGPAALCRPATMVMVRTDDNRRGHEQAEVRRFTDHDLWDYYDRVAFLTDRQLSAGRRLTRLYRAGYSEMIALPRYGQAPEGGGSVEDDERRSLARRRYNALADLIRPEGQHTMAKMVRGEFSQVGNRLQLIREACDVLADAMGLDADGEPPRSEEDE